MQEISFLCIVLLVCARALFCLKNEEIFLFGFGCLEFVNRSEVLKIEKNQKQTRCFDFHKIFQDVLLIVLNVLPLFETYSEKNQKQTRCFDFHKIFQQERRTTSSVPNVSALGFAGVPESGT